MMIGACAVICDQTLISMKVANTTQTWQEMERQEEEEEEEEELRRDREIELSNESISNSKKKRREETHMLIWLNLFFSIASLYSSVIIVTRSVVVCVCLIFHITCISGLSQSPSLIPHDEHTR